MAERQQQCTGLFCDRTVTMLPISSPPLSVHAIIVIVLAVLTPRAFGSELAATCPASIPSSSFVPGKTPEGWTGFVPHPLHLTGAGMMAGPPEAMEYLVPGKQGRNSQVFDFQQGDRQRWLWCAYSGGVQISRRLDDQATKCTVTTTRKKADASLAATVQCKRSESQ